MTAATEDITVYSVLNATSSWDGGDLNFMLDESSGSWVDDPPSLCECKTADCLDNWFE